MAKLTRDDGIEIHWQEGGSGPLVVLAPYCISYPGVFDPLVAQLESDHRVVRYDDRGTGASTRQGPYDMETGAADLAALVEALGGGAVVVAMAEGSFVSCAGAGAGAVFAGSEVASAVSLRGVQAAPLAAQQHSATQPMYPRLM